MVVANNDNWGELEQLIARELQVDEVVGVETINKVMNGAHLKTLIENLAHELRSLYGDVL